jgi:hypothetical protein
MQTLDRIEALAARARRETPPATDVRVNHLLAACQRETPAFHLPAWPAIVSAAAACILLLVTLRGQNQASTASSDSVTPLFAPVQVQMP